MNPLNYALSVRTDFSLGESSFQISQIIDQAKELGLTHVAIVDLMTVSGVPMFFEKAKKAGIIPLAGCTLRVVDDPRAKLKDRENNAYRLKVYVKSELGMQSLFKLLSKGLSEDYFYYAARVSLEDVLELEDVIVTTGDTNPIWKHPDALNKVAYLRNRFQESLYVELVGMDTPLYDKFNRIAASVAESLEIKSFIARPAFYAPGNADATDVLRAITTNTDARSMFIARPFIRDMGLIDRKAMLSEFSAARSRVACGPSTGELIKSTVGLVQAISDFKCNKRAPCLPIMAPNEFNELVKRVMAGWSHRFARKVWGHVPDRSALDATYKDRLKFELGVLQRMGFSGYFLLVQDIVNWSKENGILVGPGRGSVGGSLVAYLLGITDIDPVRFGLLFERFINPDRVDLPDADLDFESGKRHMVVDYVTQRFGADNVCGIVNFSTLGAASALRDTARLHGLESWDYACSKQMEKEHGVSLGLVESAASVPDIEKFKNTRPVIWDHAVRIEGSNRSLSKHAAGVVVAGEPVVNRGVISTRGGYPVVQWDKSQVENFGLIKIDVLGLNTLDLIQSALDYIKERHFKKIDMLALPLDDERVLEAFGKGNTVGVFQFSGNGMRKLLKDMAQGGPLTFEDVCAATALFRPGPLDAGLCDQFVQIKQGHKAPTYDHPDLEPILKETYGVMAYQEQVMQVTRVLAGFTPGEADGVRKAIGKKDIDKMREFKEKFVDGCVAISGWGAAQADRLWTDIEGYAAYSFNKSHSYEYTLISYMTMWLKVYYPAEFFAAAMTTIEKDDQLAALMMDAQANGLKVLPPDINISTDRIEIHGEDTLYAPFQAIKGLGGAAKFIADLRALAPGGQFTWVEAHVQPPKTSRSKPKDIPAHIAELDPDFQKLHLGRTKVNSAAIERLNKVGALWSVNKLGHPPLHTDRLRDRLSLMPGFTVEMVKADRGLNNEHLAKIEVTRLIEECRMCQGCSLKGKPHPVPRMGASPKFMVVTDAPTWQEEKAGKMMEGGQSDAVKALLKDRGLKFSDGYYTSLVKSQKPKEQKALTNEQINGCAEFLKREISILKPAVIVALGSNSVRWFTPGSKVSPSELAGKAIFREDMDATIIFGINPGMVFHDESKIVFLEAAFDKLSEVLN
jgi:DNA polymerase-3 subunit alpha